MSSLPFITSFSSFSSRLILLLLLILSFHCISSFAELLTGERCHPSGTPCKPPRRCENDKDYQLCSTNRCTCYHKLISACSPTNAICSDGEACTRVKSTSPNSFVCISCRLITTNSLDIELVLPNACPTPLPTPRPKGMAYTMDACELTEDCAGSRRCQTFPGSMIGNDCTKVGSMCYCYPLTFVPCQMGVSCESQEEVCAEDLDFLGPICVSKRLAMDSTQWRLVTWKGKLALPSATPTSTPFGLPVDARDANSAEGNGDGGEPMPTGPVLSSNDEGTADTGKSPAPSSATSAESEEEAVCIAQHHLNGIQRQDLVYTKMRRATVLCDVDGSCATAGHIVILHGETMTMRRYCERVGCVRRRMWVNSPRMRRGVRVGSLTHGLQFSGLAARFEVRGEGRLLGLLVRLGF